VIEDLTYSATYLYIIQLRKVMGKMTSTIKHNPGLATPIMPIIMLQQLIKAQQKQANLGGAQRSSVVIVTKTSRINLYCGVTDLSETPSSPDSYMFFYDTEHPTVQDLND